MATQKTKIMYNSANVIKAKSFYIHSTNFLAIELSTKVLSPWCNLRCHQWSTPKFQEIQAWLFASSVSDYSVLAAAAAKSLQSCPTLCDSIDGSPPGSPIPEILQARTLEWVAISFSNAWKWKVKVKSLSRVRSLPTRLLHPWDFPGKIPF